MKKVYKVKGWTIEEREGATPYRAFKLSSKKHLHVEFPIFSGGAILFDRPEIVPQEVKSLLLKIYQARKKEG